MVSQGKNDIYCACPTVQCLSCQGYSISLRTEVKKVARTTLPRIFSDALVRRKKQTKGKRKYVHYSWSSSQKFACFQGYARS